MLALAKRPNVAAKVTAMPCYAADKTYPFRSVHPHIRRVVDAFGPRRSFWGTDWSRLPCSYRQGVTMFTEEMPWLKGDDLEWVMGRGICEWIGWRNLIAWKQAAPFLLATEERLLELARAMRARVQEATRPALPAQSLQSPASGIASPSKQRRRTSPNGWKA